MEVSFPDYFCLVCLIIININILGLLEKQIIFLKITFSRVEISNLTNQTERQ